MRTPATVLSRLLATDPGTPRITMYDDSTGERIELSAKVLANWVAKAANLLVEEFDAQPGTTVRLDLPPHWRSAYWALAVWSVGAVVVTGDGPADLVICAEPDAAAGAEGSIYVTLAALARSGQDVPDGFIDEAGQLATYPDVFVPMVDPAGHDLAFDGTSYAELQAGLGEEGAHRVHTSTNSLATFLRQALSTWSTNGSLVLSRGELTTAARDQRLATERVGIDLDAIR